MTSEKTKAKVVRSLKVTVELEAFFNAMILRKKTVPDEPSVSQFVEDTVRRSSRFRDWKRTRRT